MSDLAFDLDGDPIALPANAQHWRVRRFRNPGKQGAPEVVQSGDGTPLVLPIDIGFVEFRELVEDVPGRYRLDPLDEKRKIITGAAAAYLTLADAPRNGASALAAAVAEGPETVMRELARANVEMAKVNADVSRNIADRFAGIMQAAAEVIRAADGAGIVARQPPPAPAQDAGGLANGVDDDDDEEDDVEEAKPWMQGLIEQVGPALAAWLEIKFGQQGHESAAKPAETPAPRPATPAPAVTPTPGQLMRLMAIKKLLTPEEGEVAQATAMQMTPADRAELLAELETMTVDEGAAFVRSLLPDKMKGGAS